ncbi:hypothetical protein RCL_jg360.t1 [Rhizophagus clarus]|uniref:Uncharacterized protein n=1 Tax=Rhizophagus clarus TaxID=94130 RepID=A0A8H3LZM8_9GLOM|nr:hypothetical protein RCL_jg360.t1 [Rhizophagus clarus]
MEVLPSAWIIASCKSVKLPGASGCDSELSSTELVLAFFLLEVSSTLVRLRDSFELFATSSKGNNGSLSSTTPHEQGRAPRLSTLFAQVRWITSPQTFRTSDLDLIDEKSGGRLSLLEVEV